MRFTTLLVLGSGAAGCGEAAPPPAEGPSVALVLPADGVRVGSPPGCEVTLRPGWTLQRMAWERDGEVIEGNAAGPVAGAWGRGDRLVCAVVVAHPELGRVEVRRSGAVVVGNTAPGRPVVRVSPGTLAPRDTARCRVEVGDEDGEPLTIRRRWTIDGAPAGVGETLRGRFTPGAKVRCAAAAWDGEAEGPWSWAEVEAVGAPLGGNVLVVMLDDVGIDQVGGAPEPEHAASTPTLDALAAEGVRFTAAYASPVCSPTRASLLTGRLAHQHGIGSQVAYPEPGWTLQDAEVTLPEALRQAPTPYSSAAVGKWHLDRVMVHGPLGPLVAGGFDRFAGTDANLLGVGEDGLPVDYDDWELNRDGAYERVARYHTTVVTELAAAEVDALPEPWLVYLAYASAHTPLHVPPPALVHLDPGEGWDGAEKMDAMIEAADTKLGHLLDGMDPARRARTTVIVVSDNGTASEMVEPPFEVGRGKGSLYEGGVRVPLVVAGPAVMAPGREVPHPVQVSDLYATVLDLAGLAPSTRDEDAGVAVSLLPYLVDPARESLRAFVSAERFEPLGTSGPYVYRDQMVRDGRFKLIRRVGRRELYDLVADPWESRDLLAGATAAAWSDEAARLEALLDGVLAVP